MASKKILVLVNVRGSYYLKTTEECGQKTLRNANACGYSVVSRKGKGITESLTERPYHSEAAAKEAARLVGCTAISYQALARFAKDAEVVEGEN